MTCKMERVVCKTKALGQCHGSTDATNVDPTSDTGRPSEPFEAALVISTGCPIYVDLEQVLQQSRVLSPAIFVLS